MPNIIIFDVNIYLLERKCLLIKFRNLYSWHLKNSNCNQGRREEFRGTMADSIGGIIILKYLNNFFWFR